VTGSDKVPRTLFHYTECLPLPAIATGWRLGRSESGGIARLLSRR